MKLKLPQLTGLVVAKPTPRFDLDRIDPASQPFSSGDKEADRDAIDALAVELDGLQNLLFADRGQALLVVLQGMDTSGKDGTLRHVFSRMSPLGVRVAAWKAPTAIERAHDPLWRIHAAVPAAGEIVVFNRSHYEDVLVPVVEAQVGGKTQRRRLEHFNAFERMLTESGTVVVKFMLHISRDEQRRRLQARLDDPAKRWKFDGSDLQTRKHWDDYRRAYETAIAATGTPWAPWIIVPADSKTHRNLMIASVLRRVMKDMRLRYPPLAEDLRGATIE